MKKTKQTKQTLHQKLTNPVHILMGRQGGTAKRISIRPFTFLLLTLLILAAAGTAISCLFHAGKPPDIKQQVIGLQHNQTALDEKLAEAEALLPLRDAQIESMQQQLQQDRLDMQHMQQRLDLFDQVLAERKVAGVHFLRPSAIWQNDHTIAYQLILVKGKNYPRWIKGHLTFTVLNATGHSISLSAIKKAKSGYKIEMTEQTFIEGTLDWQRLWHPKTLKITLIDYLRRNKGSIDIPVTHVSHSFQPPLTPE